jgi:5-methylcytosine-specific restriction endonuclease McrA
MGVKGTIPWNKGRKETRPLVIAKLSKSHIGKEPWNKGICNREIRYCLDCGKELTGHRNPKRCPSCAKKGINNPQWKGGVDSKKVYCVDCKKQLGVNAYRLGTTRCRACVAKLRDYRLEKSPGWKGGKSFEPYPLGWNRTFKEQIRYRDGYKCQVCGKPEVENDRKLDVHHIDYNKENIKESNLISLCRSCHMKTNGERKKWIEYLEEVRCA